MTNLKSFEVLFIGCYVPRYRDKNRRALGAFISVCAYIGWKIKTNKRKDTKTLDYGNMVRAKVEINGEYN